MTLHKNLDLRSGMLSGTVLLTMFGAKQRVIDPMLIPPSQMLELLSQNISRV